MMNPLVILMVGSSSDFHDSDAEERTRKETKRISDTLREINWCVTVTSFITRIQFSSSVWMELVNEDKISINSSVLLYWKVSFGLITRSF